MKANPALGLVTAILLLAGCGISASPTPSNSGNQADASDWSRTVAAAQREGKVSVIGPAGSAAQGALTDSFQKTYGITVDFLGGSNKTIAPQVQTERSAGQYLWDVRIGGAILEGLAPLKALAPMEPALVPEIKDPKNWRGGAMEFLDPEHQVLVLTPTQRAFLFINPNQVKADQISSYRDLLDPKWKGKIVMDDPRSTGPGQLTMAFFALHPELGQGFIREIAAQQPTLLTDLRQELDFIGQGKASVLLGGDDATGAQMIRQGLPIAMLSPRQLREGSDVAAGNGMSALFDRAPHPNAAKVYLNWLLSKEGQTAFAQAQGYISSRLDVPTSHLEDWRIPAPGAIKTYDAAAVKTRAELAPLLGELFR